MSAALFCLRNVATSTSTHLLAAAAGEQITISLSLCSSAMVIRLSSSPPTAMSVRSRKMGCSRVGISAGSDEAVRLFGVR